MGKLKPEVAEKLNKLGDMFIDAAIDDAKQKLNRPPPDYSEYRITAKGKTEQEVWEKQHSQNCIQSLNLVDRLARMISAVDDPADVREEDELRKAEKQEFDDLMKDAFKAAGITKDDLKNSQDEDDE